MLKRVLPIPLFLVCIIAIFLSKDFTTIVAGIAIFIVGMLNMENGFKCFTGGILEKILARTTQTIPKALFSGFAATAIIQSSSLVSVIVISFLSAQLIELSQAIGIIFGSNIGTTATAWIVSALGIKIKIAQYALPMLIFGVICLFFKGKSWKGAGNILLGLGFIFLGISFMKEGFETLSHGIDLSRFAMGGFFGVVLYVCIGAGITVLIQSSSATMALVITAVAAGQINYVNAIALAIGANVGTTVTAILGALTSNANGKRLAVAHFIFNGVTAALAVVFLHPLLSLVSFLAHWLSITDHDIAMKLSLFHTLFNVIGVLVITPFIGVMVHFLERLFIFKGERRGIPIYLDYQVIENPEAALIALWKETVHLYDAVAHSIVHALHLHIHDVFSEKKMRSVIEAVREEHEDLNQVYIERIKSLYSAILHFATLAESRMEKEERRKVYKLKIAARQMIYAVKDTREIEKNINAYIGGSNVHLVTEYNFFRGQIATALRSIDALRKNPCDDALIARIDRRARKSKSFDAIEVKRMGILLRDEKIQEIAASSLMNDGVFVANIIEKLLFAARVLWREGGILQDSQEQILLQEILE